MEQSLHYLLMADHSLLRKRFFAEIQPLGLTPGQPKVLEYLQAHDGTMQKDIARGCCIEPATLSPLLTGMERRGLLRRDTDGESRRSVRVCLTEEGKVLCSAIREAFAAVEARALASLSPEEAEALRSGLAKILAELEGEV